MGAEVLEEEITANSEIEAKQTTFSGVEAEEKMNVVTNKNNYENLLNGKIGDIVSLNIEIGTEEVSKAYTYVNYANSDKYEVELESETLVNISYTEIVEGLTVVDTEPSIPVTDPQLLKKYLGITNTETTESAAPCVSK